MFLNDNSEKVVNEAAHAILFAVQNTYITGTTVDVDGGWLAKHS